MLTAAPALLPDIWDNLLHLSVAYILTAFIGWEREREAHSAGVRTFPIVGIASCGYLLLLGGQPDANAQSRLLQGLVTGIGFIGGGAILKEGSGRRHEPLRHRHCFGRDEPDHTASVSAVEKLAR